MNKKRKYSQFYRILVIPDDQDEPKSYNLSIKFFKFLRIVAIILGIHILVGFVFYFQFYRVSKKNKELAEINRQLDDNNTRINKLIAEFSELEGHQERVRKLLGLGSLSNNQVPTELIIPEENSSPNYLPVYPERSERHEVSQAILRERYNFIKRSTSGFHDFEKSIPTLLPVEGVLSADYQNRTDYGPNQHRGVDIAANMGDLVKAAADGVVIFAGWDNLLGNLMIIYHGNGFYTYYGHNQRCLLPRGSLVKKGDVISYLGNSGISSAPHLHFEIWRDGVSLDPKDYIIAFLEM